MEKQVKYLFLHKNNFDLSQLHRSCFHTTFRKYRKAFFSPLLLSGLRSNISTEKRKICLQMKDISATKHSFTDDEYNETSYYFENGLRKVYPYYFNFKGFAKGRWVGKNILDIVSSEFRVVSEPVEEFKRRINEGLITVNSERIDIDYKVKQHDFISSTVHRHELPVKAESVTIIHEDKDKLVINKPASIPVHPCGRYRHNTIMFILAKEYSLNNLFAIHRLDRLTSGILIFAHNKNVAHALSQQFNDRNVKKEYICRVEGDFPNGVTICKEPLEVIHKIIGISKVSSNGKPSTTIFEKISFNGRTSLIFCRPITGRTHQIRVHLQYLGFPIVKDPLYNHTVFGPEKGRGGRINKSDEQLISDIIKIEKCRKVDSFLNRGVSYSGNGRPGFLVNESGNDMKLGPSLDTSVLFNPNNVSFDKYCHDCKVSINDPRPEELNMCLHAWKYQGPDWTFETELPMWTDDNWKD